MTKVFLLANAANCGVMQSVIRMQSITVLHVYSIVNSVGRVLIAPFNDCELHFSSYIVNLVIAFASIRQATPSVTIKGCSANIRH